MTTAKDLGIQGIEEIELLDVDGSSVFRARQPGLDRSVAVKLLDPAQKPLVPKRFDLRRRALTKFAELPGVVSVYEAGITPSGRQYLLMPYFGTGSLEDQLRHGPMPWHRAVKLTARSAEIVAKAHDMELVLGDLKPSSILLADAETPLISMYGMATRRTVNGSSAYLAPEATPGASLLPSADVYSLCLILAALIAGRPPDDGERPQELMADLGDPAPRRILEVVERGISRAPVERFSDADALATALLAAIDPTVDNDLAPNLGTVADPELETLVDPTQARAGSSAAPSPETDDPFDFEALLELPTSGPAAKKAAERHRITPDVVDPAPPPPGSLFNLTAPSPGQPSPAESQSLIDLGAAPLFFDPPAPPPPPAPTPPTSESSDPGLGPAVASVVEDRPSMESVTPREEAAGIKTNEPAEAESSPAAKEQVSLWADPGGPTALERENLEKEKPDKEEPERESQPVQNKAGSAASVAVAPPSTELALPPAAPPALFTGSIWDLPDAVTPDSDPQSEATAQHPATTDRLSEDSLFPPRDEPQARWLAIGATIPVQSPEQSPMATPPTAAGARPSSNVSPDLPIAAPRDESMPFRTFERQALIEYKPSRLGHLLESIQTSWFNRRRSLGGVIAVLAFAAIAGVVVSLLVRDFRPPETTTGSPLTVTTIDQTAGPSAVPPTSVAPVLSEPASTHVTLASRGTVRRLTTTGTVATTVATSSPSTTDSSSSTSGSTVTTTATTTSSTTSSTSTTAPPTTKPTTSDPSRTTQRSTTTNDEPEGPREPLIQNATVSRIRPTTARISFDSPECVAASFSYQPSGGLSSQVDGGSSCSTAHTLLLGVVTPALKSGTTYTVVITATDGDITIRQTLTFTTLG